MAKKGSPLHMSQGAKEGGSAPLSGIELGERPPQNENPMRQTSLPDKSGGSAEALEMGLENIAPKKLNTRKDNSKPMDWRLDVLDFLDDPHSGRGAQLFSVFMITCIVSSTTVFCVATAPRFQGSEYVYVFEQCEWAFNIFFTAELLVRLACGRKKMKPVYDGAKVKCPMMLFDSFIWFDFISVLPFWIEKAISGNRKGARYEGTLLSLLKSFRMFRLFKLARRYQGTIILRKAVRRSSRALLVPTFFLFVAAVFFGTFIWATEEIIMKDDSQFDSIPHTIWFVVATMTGHANITPESTIGKMLAILCMLFGLVFLAMPLAIVGGQFSDIWAEKEKVIFLQQLKILRLKRITHEEMSRIFDDFDETGDGSLDFHEFEAALTNLNIKLKDRQIKKLWSTLDSDKSGLISRSDFMLLVKDWHYDYNEDEGYWAQTRNIANHGTSHLAKFSISPPADSSVADDKSSARTHIPIDVSRLEQLLGMQNEMLEKLEVRIDQRMKIMEKKLNDIGAKYAVSPELSSLFETL